MPLLQVRDFPPDVYDKIGMAARKENRTIAQQTVVLLRKSLGQEESNRERRKMLFERCMARHIADDVKVMDDAALVREDRNR